MGPQSLETFARRYLRLSGDQIQTISSSRRDNKDGLKFDILEHWRNQNPGPNARAVGIIIHFFLIFNTSEMNLNAVKKMKIYVFTH